MCLASRTSTSTYRTDELLLNPLNPLNPRHMAPHWHTAMHRPSARWATETGAWSSQVCALPSNDTLSYPLTLSMQLAQYGKAYAAMDERAEYRRLLEVKLNALGVDVAPAAEGKK